jgi:hypothetical protein
VKCFITIFIHTEDGAKGLEQKQKIATELLSKQGYKTEGTKIAKGGRRVTIYTTIESKEAETHQQAIDKVCQIISQATGRKTVGRPLKSSSSI